MLFNVTDDRTWLRTDTSDAFQGRHSGKLNVPTHVPVLLKIPVPSNKFAKNGLARLGPASGLTMLVTVHIIMD